jgi:hypothetical protein
MTSDLGSGNATVENPTLSHNTKKQRAIVLS